MFFLREFITDATIPAKFRREMLARRRTRELLRGPALGIQISRLQSILTSGTPCSAESALEVVRSQGHFRYFDPKKIPKDFALVWSVGTVCRGRKVLTYRTGRYRDDRDSFAQKRSVCFATPVMEKDQSLFESVAFGVVEASLNAVATDLNVPIGTSESPTSSNLNSFRYDLSYISLCDEGETPEILVLVSIAAPDWFEPAQSRLSINDLRWMDLDRPPNNVADFDPWSQALFENWSNCWRVDDARSDSLHNTA